MERTVSYRCSKSFLFHLQPSIRMFLFHHLKMLLLRYVECWWSSNGYFGTDLAQNAQRVTERREYTKFICCWTFYCWIAFYNDKCSKMMANSVECLFTVHTLHSAHTHTHTYSSSTCTFAILLKNALTNTNRAKKKQHQWCVQCAWVWCGRKVQV